MRAPKRLVVLGVASALLTACHSSSHPASLSAEQVRARVDAACHATAHPTSKPPGDALAAAASDLPAWHDYLAASLPRLETTVRRMRAAVPPHGETIELRGFFARYDAVDVNGREAFDAAGRADVAGFHAAVVDLVHHAHLADAAASSMGLRSCASG